MKTSKSIYTECFPEYRLDNNQLAILQEELLKMFTDLKNVFDKYDIKYMMSGGSLLGTVRHKGFIPWDDDIDLMMTRKEFGRFRDLFMKELGDKYIQAEPLSDPLYFSKMPKVFKKNTVYIEIPTAGLDAFHMMFIDIFIIENIPKSGIYRNLISFVYNISFKGSSFCLDYLYPSPVIEEKMKTNKELSKYYKFRRMIGFFFSHIGGIKFYLTLLNKLASKFDETGWKGVPSAISYEREVFQDEVFTDISKGTFCGVEVNIPTHFDTYLKNLYGDYVKLPPLEQREIHGVYKIVL